MRSDNDDSNGNDNECDIKGSERDIAKEGHGSRCLVCGADGVGVGNVRWHYNGEEQGRARWRCKVYLGPGNYTCEARDEQGYIKGSQTTVVRPPIVITTTVATTTTAAVVPSTTTVATTVKSTKSKKQKKKKKKTITTAVAVPITPSPKPSWVATTALTAATAMATTVVMDGTDRGDRDKTDTIIIIILVTIIVALSIALYVAWKCRERRDKKGEQQHGEEAEAVVTKEKKKVGACRALVDRWTSCASTSYDRIALTETTGSTATDIYVV